MKDHRIGFESGNINAIMDGYIKQFIDAYLVAGSGMRRRNAVDSETAENVRQLVLTCSPKSVPPQEVNLWYMSMTLGELLRADFNEFEV